jgi:hypothetical protein
MHNISEDVRGESSENEDEGPAEPTSSSSPVKLYRACAFRQDLPHQGLFATESGPIVPALSRTLSVSSMTQQQPTSVPGEQFSLPRRWSYAASNASSKAYDVAGKRGPGNPLIPASLARLALGPTLTAKYVFFFLESQRTAKVAFTDKLNPLQQSFITFARLSSCACVLQPARNTSGRAAREAR